MTDKIGKKRIGRIIAVALLAMTLVVGLIPNQALAAETKIADAVTIDKYLESLGDEASTEYAGRIWTDKSVYADDARIPLKTGEVKDIDNESDFLVAYSALATGVEVTGNTVTPMDVVFIIDLSSSMSRSSNRMDNGQLRVYNATVALNNAVKEILEINEYVRIGVVGYNRNAFTILPLDHYEQVNNRQFFTCSGSTITVNADGTENNDYNNRQVSTDTGTNIQQGLYAGMNMLASTSSTTVLMNGMEVKRVPSVVLLTDGEPSVGSPDQEWWKPDASVSNSASVSPDTVDGMKALMTATYMKGEVNRHYGISGANGMNLYSIGVGIETVSDSYRDLAYATINPNDTTLKNRNNTRVGNMRSTWSAYAANRTATLDGYTFSHPRTNDIVGDGDISQLYYVDEYYSVEDADAMTDAFSSIVTSISVRAAESPTELKHADPSETGFISYTDPIGKYMEVKGIKGIIYNGVYHPSEDGKTVSGKVVNQLYDEEDLSDVEITIEGTAGVDQQLKIDIPASLIPMRINTVDLNADGTVKSHTNNGSWPIRVIYEVGLIDDVLVDKDAAERVIDTEKIDDDYLAANTDAATGNISFYSNLYTSQKVDDHEHTFGDATASFEPADTNSFYYMQGDEPIYELVGNHYQQVEGINKDDLDNDKIYYYVTNYYHGISVEKKYLERTGAQLKRVNIIEKDGYLYREADSPRVNRILEFAGNKTNNVTKTADDFYYPTFVGNVGDPLDGKFVVHLGNNGKLSIPATGALEISKTVTAAEGLTAPDAKFEFTVNLGGDTDVEGEFDYVIVGTETTGTIKDGGKIVLKDGQTVRITGLAPGTTYEVIEKAVAGFTSSATGDTGTINAGEISEADFTNTYSVTSLIWPTDETLTGTKKFTNITWDDGQEFTFVMRPSEVGNTVVPTNGRVTVTEPDEGKTDEATFDFGTLSFDKPGTYNYTIVEQEPGNALPGVTYSRALYEVNVVVVDNGDGSLSASSTITKMYDDDAREVSVEDAPIVFTNTYNADSVVRVPVAIKVYEDTTGSKPLTDGMFAFKLEAVTPGAPVPAGVSPDGSITVTNVGGNVTFPSVEFKMSDLGTDDSKTFRYRFTEVKGNIPGMEYDDTVFEADLVVSKGSDELSVVATYYKIVNEVRENARIPEFKNTYNPSDAKVTLEGEKVYSTANGLNPPSADFSFTLDGENAAADAYLKETTASVTGSGEFDFGEMTFDKVGVYKFIMSENVPADNAKLPGIVYDEHKVIVTVTVTDVNGQLVADVAYDNGDGTEEAKFVNIYEPDPAIDDQILLGTKTLIGKPLVAGEFFFEVHVIDENDQTIGTPYLVPHAADADGDGVASITFGQKITFTEPGTYRYLIKEQIPAEPVPGNTYDTTEYRYTVIVTDDGGGTLQLERKLESRPNAEAEWTAYDDSGAYKYDAVNFVNSYKAQPATIAVPVMNKVVNGYNELNYQLEGGEFKFQLTGDETNGMKLPDVTEVTNDENGIIEFGNITFSKEGTYAVTITEVVPDDVDELAGMTYTTTPIKVNFTVTDNRTGQLVARVSGVEGGRIFTNTYAPTPGIVELEIKKNFTGRPWETGDSFDFEVVVLDPATQAAIKAGDIEFPMDSSGQEIAKKTITQKGETITGEITVNHPGTYKFIVRELTGNIPGVHYDSTNREITIVATDNQENGKIVTDVTIKKGETEVDDLTFNNVYDEESTELSGHDNLVITKAFTGRENEEWLDKDEFNFTLEAKETYGDAVELPSKTTLKVTNANKAHPHFGNIIFHKEGTYTFVVKEVKGTIPGVTYDEDPVEVTVVVKNNYEKGALEVTSVSYTKAGQTIGEILFKNKYTTAELTTKLSVTKKLTGRDWFGSDAFTFTLSAEDDATEQAIVDKAVKLPDNKTLVVKDEEEKFFDAITFTKPGVYSFEIVEVSGDDDNIIYDGHNLIYEVTVADNKVGALVAISVESFGSRTFENVYKPDAVPVLIEGEKELNGRTLAAEEFEFELVEVDEHGAVVDGGKNLNAKNDADGKISFGEISYTEAGTHYYKITEEAGSLPGIAYDDGYVIAKVDVTYDSKKGVLSAATAYEKYDKDGNELVGEGFAFVNEYTSEQTDLVDLSLIKTVTATEGNAFTMDGDEFTFIIERATANPGSDPVASGTVTNGAEVNGEATATIFDGATFTEAGTYVYTVYESDSVPAGFSKDPSVYTVTVEVTDDESIAKLQSAVTITKEGQTVNEIRFNNNYNPAEATLSFSGKKTLDSEHKTIEADRFQFQLTGVGDAPMPVTGGEVAKNNETGHFQFGTITYVKPGSYEYVVSEVDLGEAGYSYDSNTYTIKVDVTDDAGTLKATTTDYLDDQGQSKIEFINGYVPAPAEIDIDGIKELVVPEGSPRKLKAEEFTFELLNEAGEIIGTAKNDKEGAFTFGKVAFDKAGTYNYKIVEVNSNIPGVTDDPKKEINVRIEVVDENGQLDATVSYPDGNTFTNTYVPLDTNAKIVLGGVKVLEGKGNNGLEGGDFTFQLKDESGKVVDTASNDKHGAVTFKEIKYTEEGTYKYTVSEVKGTDERITYDDTVYEITVNVKDGGEGYLVVDVQKSAESILFTNYYDAPEPIISIVKTQAVNGGNPTTEKLDVEAGDEVTYYLQIANAEGAGIASNLTVTDKVLEGLEVVEISGNGVERNGIVTWYLSDMAGDDEPVTVWFKVKVPAVEVDTEWENVATAAYDDPNDPDDDTPDTPDKEEPSNTVEVEEDVEPALTITKEASQNNVKAGNFVTYTITVKNTGDGKAEGVIVTDILPEGLIFVEADKDGTEADGIVTWNIGDLAAGKKAVVKVIVEVPEVAEDTEWQNVATVVYNEPGEDPQNSVPSEPEIIEIDVNPEVELTKEQAVNDNEPTAEKQFVKEGDLITYYLTVQNNGTGDATDVVIIDNIPEGLELVDAGDGVEEDGTITWEIDKLAAGEKKVVYFIVSVPEVDEDIDYANTAQLTYDGQGEEPDNSNTVVAKQAAPEPEEPKNDAPDTGDDTNMMLWLMLLGLSGAGLAGTAVFKRRRG